MKIENAANLFKALSTERRLRVFMLLLEHGDLNSSEIARQCNLKDAITSECLSKLLAVGWVWRQPTPPWVYYGVNLEVLKKVIEFFGEHYATD